MEEYPKALVSKNDLEALPKKPEEPVVETLTQVNWPSLPVSQETKEPSLQASSIPPKQKTPINNSSLVYQMKDTTTRWEGFFYH